MFNMVNYTHLSTKIRAMQGQMLKNEDFDNLLEKESVKDIAIYLKHHTCYRNSFEGLKEEDLHRGDLEVLLYRALLTDALKIARYLKGTEKEVYRFVYRKQEVEDLKKMMRALQMGKPLTELNRRTLFVSKQSHIDFNVSLKATTMKQLIDSLKGTNFQPILEPLLIDNKRINLFAAEMALDLYYYKQLSETILKKTSGKDKELLLMSFGLEVDVRNIMWIYRGKKYYDISKGILYSYMLPGGYKLKKDKIVDLVETETPEQVLSQLKRGPYKDIVDFSSGNWDNSFYKYYGHKQNRLIRFLPFTIAPIIGYIFIKEIEIMNLTTIIEGIRYKVEPSKIESYLARRVT